MINKKICPKVDIKLGGLNSVNKYIKNRMEIHLLDMNINFIKNKLKYLILNIPSLNQIVLHLPGNCLDIERIASEDKKDKELKQLINMCSNLNLNLGTKIKFEILAHCGWTERNKISDSCIIKYLRKLLIPLKEHDITFLLEDTMEVYSDNPKDYDRASYLVNKLRNKHIRLCLDLSHLKAICNRLKLTDKGFLNYFRFVKPIQVEQIHVNSSINGDGYINMKTHGVKHFNLNHLREDFKLLDLLHVNNKYLVPEVAEYSNVYKKRKCEVKEINLINML